MLVLAWAVGAAAKDSRPNILWLVSEDNSASWMGCYGNELAKTPNKRSLHAEEFISKIQPGFSWL